MSGELDEKYDKEVNPWIKGSLSSQIWHLRRAFRVLFENFSIVYILPIVEWLNRKLGGSDDRSN